MKRPFASGIRSRHPHRETGGGAIRPLLVAIGIVCLGVIAFWMLQPSHPAKETAAPPPSTLPVPPVTTSRLSASTLAVLRRPGAPVDIRLYSLLNETQGTTETRAFAERVFHLLSEYGRESGGRLQVHHITSPTAGKNAALADGIEPLQLDRKGASFLGVAFQCGTKRAVIPRLSAEWEEALEYDLSRAIARVSGGSSGGELVADPSPGTAADAADLLRVLPDIESLSLEEARQRLQAAGREEFESAVTEIQRELLEAQRRLADARERDPAAVEAAQSQLQLLQRRQGDQLRDISLRMQSRIAALERVKHGK